MQTLIERRHAKQHSKEDKQMHVYFNFKKGSEVYLKNRHNVQRKPHPSTLWPGWPFTWRSDTLWAWLWPLAAQGSWLGNGSGALRPALDFEHIGLRGDPAQLVTETPHRRRGSQGDHHRLMETSPARTFYSIMKLLMECMLCVPLMIFCQPSRREKVSVQYVSSV